MIDDDRAQRALQWLVDHGDAIAEARAQAEHLDDMRRVILAEIAGKLDGSEAARDREARTSAEYRDFLAGLNAARERYYKLLNKSVAARSLLDAWRTQCANLREVK